MKNEDKPNFPMDKNDEIQSSSKKKKRTSSRYACK
jgi:hypothetical protein